MSPKKSDTEEMVNQIADDLLEYLNNYSEHVNTQDPDVQSKIEELANAVAESIVNCEIAEEEGDDFLSFEGDMDQYSGGGDDD